MSTIWRHFLSLLMKTKNDWLIKVSVPNWYWKACIVLAWHMTIRTLCSNFSLTATEQSWTMTFESSSWELSGPTASHWLTGTTTSLLSIKYLWSGRAAPTIPYLLNSRPLFNLSLWKFFAIQSFLITLGSTFQLW